VRKTILIALALAMTAPVTTFVFPTAAAEARGGCGRAYYRNSRGRCVHRPVRAWWPPIGASARCRDGTFSFSQSRRGTCSWHGGVAFWLFS
jgi:Protein of unknown function (DUF3761)